MLPANSSQIRGPALSEKKPRSIATGRFNDMDEEFPILGSGITLRRLLLQQEPSESLSCQV